MGLSFRASTWLIVYSLAILVPVVHTQMKSIQDWQKTSETIDTQTVEDFQEILVIEPFQPDIHFLSSLNDVVKRAF